MVMVMVMQVTERFRQEPYRSRACDMAAGTRTLMQGPAAGTTAAQRLE